MVKTVGVLLLPLMVLAWLTGFAIESCRVFYKGGRRDAWRTWED